MGIRREVVSARYRQEKDTEAGPAASLFVSHMGRIATAARTGTRNIRRRGICNLLRHPWFCW